MYAGKKREHSETSVICMCVVSVYFHVMHELASTATNEREKISTAPASEKRTNEGRCEVRR